MADTQDEVRVGMSVSGICLGVAMGAAPGVVFGNLALGIGPGMAIGAIVGLLLGNKHASTTQQYSAKDHGRDA